MSRHCIITKDDCDKNINVLQSNGKNQTFERVSICLKQNPLDICCLIYGAVFRFKFLYARGQARTIWSQQSQECELIKQNLCVNMVHPICLFYVFHQCIVRL